MKLEVGMYVRTRYGYIAKLKKINKTDRYTEYEFDNKIGYDYDGFFRSIVEDCIDDIEIIKASHNIIDLIQDGDIYYYIAHDEWDYGSSDYEDVGILCEEDRYFVEGLLEENRLISVVTKEQFESMSYKVGD